METKDKKSKVNNKRQYCTECGYRFNEAKSTRKSVYFRLHGNFGTYLFEEVELKRALDRENEGVVGIIKTERELY